MVFMVSFLSLPALAGQGCPTSMFLQTRLPEQDLHLALAAQFQTYVRPVSLTEVCHGDAKGANILYTNDGGADGGKPRRCEAKAPHCLGH